MSAQTYYNDSEIISKLTEVLEIKNQLINNINTSEDIACIQLINTSLNNSSGAYLSQIEYFNRIKNLIDSNDFTNIESVINEYKEVIKKFEASKSLLDVSLNYNKSATSKNKK